MSTGSMTLSPRASMANEDPSLPAHLGRVHEAAEALMNYALERLDANEVRIAPSIFAEPHNPQPPASEPTPTDHPRLTTPRAPRPQAKHEDLREQFNVAREQMDRERASAHTSERLADLRREGSVKAAEFERLASALDEEADEVEAQYRRMERAAAVLRGAQKEVTDLLSLLGGVLEDLVDLEESADEAEAKAAGRSLGGGRSPGGKTLTLTLDAGRAAEDDASARAFEAARAAAIASAASLLRNAGLTEGKSYATADRVDELARTTTDVAAELVTRMERALDEEEGTRKLLERARAARGANGTLVSFGSGSSEETSSETREKLHHASFITGSTVDSPALLRVGGGYAGSPPKHGHALRAKMARDLEMHVRALTQRAKKAAREADLLERHLARVDRFQDESVGELELALWLLRGVDELTRREKAERLAAAKARSDKFKPSGQSVKYGKLKSIADKKRTAKKKPPWRALDDEGADEGADEPPSPLHRHRERVQQRRMNDADLLRGFDLDGGTSIGAGSKPRAGSNDDAKNVATVRKALAGAMESAAILDDDDDDDDARGVEVAPGETTSTPPPAAVAGVHRGSALPPTPGADVSAKILNDGKTPARVGTSVERSSDVRGPDAEGAEGAEEMFHTPATEPERASRPTPSPSPPERKGTYILPFGKATYKSFKRNVLGIPSKKDKGASKG